MIRNVRLIYLHNFLLYFRPQWAFMAIYTSQVTGSYTAGMFVLALQRVSSALTDIPTGILSDKIGRKKTLILGSTAMFIMTFFYAFAHGLWFLIIGSIFCGLGESFFSGNNDALLYETLKSNGKEEHYHHFHSRSGSMCQLGLGLSAFVSIFFVTNGLQKIFLISIIPQLLSLLVSFFIAESNVHKRNDRKSFEHFLSTCHYIIKNRNLFLLTIGNSISTGAGEAHFNFITVFIQTLWPVWGLGVYRFLHHSFAFIGFIASGKIIDKLTAPFVLTFSRSYVFVASGLALFFANKYSPILYLSNALTFGPYTVARNKILQNAFTNEERATMGSVVSFASRIVYGLTIFILGILSDVFSIRWAALGAIGFAMLSLLFFLTFYKGTVPLKVK